MFNNQKSIAMLVIGAVTIVGLIVTKDTFCLLIMLVMVMFLWL